MQKTAVSSSEIGSPKFILWAIFREEFRRPNQCLVAFGNYATGRFQHCRYANKVKMGILWKYDRIGLTGSVHVSYWTRTRKLSSVNKVQNN